MHINESDIIKSPTQNWTLPEDSIRKRFNILIQLMVESKSVSSIPADNVEVQYSGLLQNVNFISKMKSFDTQSDRLDELWIV